jgi:hypothetical protein
MGMMRCTTCEAIVDSDDGTGVWEDVGTGFWCETCVEAACENPAKHERIMDALKVQDLETWEEAINNWYDTQDSIVAKAEYDAEKATENYEAEMRDAGRYHQTEGYRDAMLDAADIARKGE